MVRLKPGCDGRAAHEAVRQFMESSDRRMLPVLEDAVKQLHAAYAERPHPGTLASLSKTERHLAEVRQRLS